MLVKGATGDTPYSSFRQIEYTRPLGVTYELIIFVCIFFQTEAPLLIRPFLKDMTASEIHAVMTGGFATIAGSVLAAYILFGVRPFSFTLCIMIKQYVAATKTSSLVMEGTNTYLTTRVGYKAAIKELAEIPNFQLTSNTPIVLNTEMLSKQPVWTKISDIICRHKTKMY